MSLTALIHTAIGQQGFEKVKDRIAEILLVELTNQKQLQEFEEDIEVFNERIAPMDEAETLYFNILLDSGSYSNKNQLDQEGNTIYFIDVYTSGKAGEQVGTSDSTQRRDKFLGMVRYILSDTRYNMLGFDYGLIAGSQVERFSTLDPSHKEDSSYTNFGRLQFSVRIVENQTLWDGVEVVGNNTNVKLDLTDKGFKYIFQKD
jgi:hypothetical protein